MKPDFTLVPMGHTLFHCRTNFFLNQSVSFGRTAAIASSCADFRFIPGQLRFHLPDPAWYFSPAARILVRADH
jgi:hypothetical protein